MHATIARPWVSFLPPLIEGLDRWIATNRRQRRHVKHGAHHRAAIPDMALTLILSAIVVEGHDAHQRTDLAPGSGNWGTGRGFTTTGRPAAVRVATAQGFISTGGFEHDQRR